MHLGDGPQQEQKPSSGGRPRGGRSGGGPRGGLSALLEFFRGIPDRLRRPESLLMLMALLASIGAHMPTYLGLGALADFFERSEKEKEKAKPVEVSFEMTDPSTEPEKVELPKPVEKPRPERKKPEPKKAEEKREQAELEPPKEEPKKPDLKISELELPKPPPPTQQRKQSITQKSVDPSVEPPPDTKFLAEENMRVEEETVAKVTSETRDDPEPQASAPQAPGPEESGDSKQTERGKERGGDSEDMTASAAQKPSAPPTTAQ